MFEHDGRDLDLIRDRRKLLRIVGAVVIADAGVVATHDEVRATVILADQGVQDGSRGPACIVGSASDVGRGKNSP
jgi:hypothetical protein